MINDDRYSRILNQLADHDGCVPVSAARACLLLALDEMRDQLHADVMAEVAHDAESAKLDLMRQVQEMRTQVNSALATVADQKETIARMERDAVLRDHEIAFQSWRVTELTAQLEEALGHVPELPIEEVLPYIVEELEKRTGNGNGNGGGNGHGNGNGHNGTQRRRTLPRHGKGAEG